MAAQGHGLHGADKRFRGRDSADRCQASPGMPSRARRQAQPLALTGRTCDGGVVLHELDDVSDAAARSVPMAARVRALQRRERLSEPRKPHAERLHAAWDRAGASVIARVMTHGPRLAAACAHGARRHQPRLTSCCGRAAAHGGATGRLPRAAGRRCLPAPSWDADVEALRDQRLCVAARRGAERVTGARTGPAAIAVPHRAWRARGPGERSVASVQNGPFADCMRKARATPFDAQEARRRRNHTGRARGSNPDAGMRTTRPAV